jgi:polygalacturonase
MSLAIFALTVHASASVADARASHRYLIPAYGAVADGKTVNTQAIQSAIDCCARSQTGDVVVIPKGTFLSGAIMRAMSTCQDFLSMWKRASS